MKKAWFIALIPGMLVGMALLVVLALFLIKLVWAWAIPDLFPGAVKQGLIAADISWYTSFKLAILVAVLGGISQMRGSGKKG